jgi:hypothetical protein
MVPGFVIMPLVTSRPMAVTIPFRRLPILHDLGRHPRPWLNMHHLRSGRYLKLTLWLRLIVLRSIIDFRRFWEACASFLKRFSLA